jgi:putative membrane protein insertion efficiency factor
MKKSIFLFILSLLLLINIALGQGIDKWSDYWEKPAPVFTEPFQPITYPGFFKSSALVWIRIYQKGISSQDLPACVFHPSCSRFAFGAIQQAGPVKGILLAGDRLLRCNPFALPYYQFDGEKLSDPVEKYVKNKK